MNGLPLVTVTMDASVRVATNIVPNIDITGWLYVEHGEFGTITKRLEHHMTMNEIVFTQLSLSGCMLNLRNLV